MLVVALLVPLVLQDYLTVFATRVIILALFALSFDLVWGYAGIMSFGQALFFGSAGYGVALLARDLDITNDLPGAAGGHAHRPHLRAAARRLPAARTASLQRDLRRRSARLTGSYAADRLARGWYYLGGQNGIPSIPSMTLGGYEFTEGPAFYYLVLGILVVGLSALPFPGALAVRSGARRPARERAAHRLLRLQGAAPQGDHLRDRRRHRRARRQPLCLPRRLRLAQHGRRRRSRRRWCSTCCSAAPAR